MTEDEGPAERHRRFAATFTARVEGTQDWDAPAPVDGWTARDVVDHLTTWFPGFLASSSDVRLPDAPSATDDPVAAWRIQTDAIQALLDDPASARMVVSNPHIGEMPLPTAVDMIYSADVFMHTWDLARATGQDEELDPAFCARLLGGMEGMEDVLRGSGQYGPRVEVPADADVQTRMLGFIGRDPWWKPAPPPPGGSLD